MTRKCADGTGGTKGGHDEIRPVYREEFADRGLSCVSTDWAWNIFLDNGEDYTEYPMLNEQDRVTSYRNNPVASEGAQGNSTSSADKNIENLPKGVDDDEDWDFDCVICGEFAQRVSVKRKLQDLQDERRTRKRKVPTNVTEVVELV